MSENKPKGTKKVLIYDATQILYTCHTRKRFQLIEPVEFIDLPSIFMSKLT